MLIARFADRDPGGLVAQNSPRCRRGRSGERCPGSAALRVERGDLSCRAANALTVHLVISTALGCVARCYARPAASRQRAPARAMLERCGDRTEDRAPCSRSRSPWLCRRRPSRRRRRARRPRPTPARPTSSPCPRSPTPSAARSGLPRPATSRPPPRCLTSASPAIPGSRDLHAARAAVAMLAGDPPAALAHLEAAAAGPRPRRLRRRPALRPARRQPRARAAARGAARHPPGAGRGRRSPAPVVGGVARVAAGNTAWNPATERLEPRFAFPERAEGPARPSRRPKTAAYDILREH